MSNNAKNIKAKATECILLYFEATFIEFATNWNFSDSTHEALIAFLKSKNAKVAQAALSLLAVLIEAFGPENFSLIRYKEVIYAGANQANQKCRQEALNCIQSTFLWLGLEGVTPFLEPLKKF